MSAIALIIFLWIAFVLLRNSFDATKYFFRNAFDLIGVILGASFIFLGKYVLPLLLTILTWPFIFLYEVYKDIGKHREIEKAKQAEIIEMEMAKTVDVYEHFRNHPLLAQTKQIKNDYLQFLLFTALEEENEEEEVFSSAKENYLKLFIQYSDLDESMLETLKQFAPHLQGDELIELTNKLASLDEDLRIHLMAEVILFAIGDVNFDKKHYIFEDYLQALKLEEQKDSVLQLATFICDI